MSGNFGANFARSRRVNGKEVISECDKYTKVYNSAYNRNKVMMLPACAHSLLLYIIFKCEPRSYEITINKSKYMKEARITDKTVNKAIKALISADILRHKSENTYYFDYTLLFQGSKIHTNIQTLYPYE